MILSPIDDDLRRQVNQLVDTYRDRCLWFLRADYYPTDLQDVLRTLDYIRRYGDREAFRKAGELYRADLTQLIQDLAEDKLIFHAGSIRGAFPQVT